MTHTTTQVPAKSSGRVKHLAAASLAVAMVLTSGPAVAGRNCDTPQPPKAEVVTRALGLAERTLNALNASGAQVVVLARAGQDLSKYGLKYSHLGFAYKQADPQGASVWRVLHKLNQCGTALSAIYRQGLGDFFMDDLWLYEAAWVVPTPAVQAKLLDLLQDEPRTLQLHHKPYNMVSYVWGQKYQQSNQWAIETLAAAMSANSANSPFSRTQAQAWLQSHSYQPSTLKIGALSRLGGRAGSANIAFDDHPSEKRFSDRIETVTVDSVFAWLPRAGLSTQPMVVLQ